MLFEKVLQLPCHGVIAASIKSVSIVDKLSLLSNEEAQRANRFRREEDKQRYILAHALKRYCLSRLLNTTAAQLVFSNGAKGKPHCESLNAPSFNISHSGDWVLLGLSSKGDIGVDVEASDREVSDAVANYALTKEQLIDVNQFNKPHNQFMIYWTQKEAISKALGLGLSIDFQTVECSGVLGNSILEHSNETLYVHSRCSGNYMFSIASTVNDDLTFYALNSWTKAGLLLETMLNTPE